LRLGAIQRASWERLVRRGEVAVGERVKLEGGLSEEVSREAQP
jgi:hypothetical protein